MPLTFLRLFMKSLVAKQYLSRTLCALLRVCRFAVPSQLAKDKFICPFHRLLRFNYPEKKQQIKHDHYDLHKYAKEFQYLNPKVAWSHHQRLMPNNFHQGRMLNLRLLRCDPTMYLRLE